MNWLRNVAALAALIVGVGMGSNALAATPYYVDQDPGSNASPVTLTNGDSLLLVGSLVENEKWKPYTINVTGSAWIGKNNNNNKGYGGLIEVQAVNLSGGGSLTINKGMETGVGVGTTFKASMITFGGGNTLTINGAATDVDANKVMVMSLESAGLTSNTITVGERASLAVEGTSTFGSQGTSIAITKGSAIFSGAVNLTNSSNTIFDLKDNASIDFRQGLVINGSNNSITSTTSGNNVAGFGSAGVTASIANAISVTNSNLHIVTDASTWNNGSGADGKLTVTKAGAIALTTGNLHTDSYVVTSGVAGTGGGLENLYSGTPSGSVNTATFIVEKGAKAQGNAAVKLNASDTVAIDGHYSLGVAAATESWAKGGTVTGILESNGSSIINSTSDTVNFTIGGGDNMAIIKNTGGGLSLNANTTGKHTLKFIGAMGTAIEGNVTATDYDASVESDLTFTKAGSLATKTYTQSNSDVLAASGATATITTSDPASVARIRNNSTFGVSGTFAGDVDVRNNSKLLGAGNSIASTKGTGVMNIDSTSSIDIQNGSLTLRGFSNVKADGTLYLGANSTNIHQLNLGGATMNIDTKKIQMNDDFVKAYYNSGSDTDDGTNPSTRFITGGTVNNGVTGWTVSNAFGDFTFKNGATGSWVETYAKTDVSNTAAVETQLKKNWGPNVVSNSVAGATAMAARSMLGLPNGLATDGSPEGLDNLAMLQALASGTKGASFTLANGSAGTFDNGIMAGFNGAIASGPIYVAQDTFRDIATGLHSRLDAYRKVIECINVNPSPDAAIAAPAAYGSLGLASVDRYMNRFWAGGFGTWQKAKARNGFDGYKYDGAGVSLGYDRSFGPAVMGLGFTYVEGNYDDYSATSSDSKIKQYVANAYATVNASSGFFATAMTGFNYSENDLQDVRGGIMTDRDYHTLSFYAGGRLGYDIEPCDNLSVSPSVGADFFWSRSGSYDVKFADGSQPWHYNKMKNHNIEIPVEVKVAYDINWGDNKTLTLMANGGYAYNLNDHGVWGNIDATGTDAPEIRAVGRKLGHHSWKGGAGIRFRMNNWDVGAKYDYQGRSNFNAHRLSAQVGYSF